MGKPPRSYGQFCGLARTLDVIGDRWALLIVRELLAGQRRFGDLLSGLPGVATNLLTKRLRQLERDGLVERRLDGGSGRGVVYALTARGADLREAIDALLRWSTPLMASGPGTDAFRPHWLAVALSALIRARPSRTIRVGLKAGAVRFVVIANRNGVAVAPAADEPVAAWVVGDGEVLLALAAGALDLRSALRRGATMTGDRTAVELLFGAARSANAGRGPATRRGEAR